MEILSTLGQIVGNLATLVRELFTLGWHYILIILWVVWWLRCVNWKRTWNFLGQGAWAPLLLLMFLGTLAWSQILPGRCDCLGFISIPNFVWQLGYVGLLVAIALFCGWLQGILHWTPAEVNLDPPAHSHHHGHGHDHGHGH